MLNTLIFMAKKSKRAESRARYFIRKQASEKGWNLNHISKNGDVLEEQEITDVFPEINLGTKRPDFMFCLQGVPAIVIEAKNDFRASDEAIDQAIKYCNKINQSKKYNVKIAIGVAGEEDHGYIVKIRYLVKGSWEDLKSKGNSLTAILSKQECIKALEANNSTTEVTIPSQAEFVDSAIEVSNILRTAKIETTLRPKVVGTVTTALYEGDLSVDSKTPLKDINDLMIKAINKTDHFEEDKKKKLIESLSLTTNDFDRLTPYIYRIVSILKRLNVRAVLQSDADFLGLFYEAFLRYGADNNAMGIVFTPRHITRLCTNLVKTEIGFKIIDIACGTGGFLVSAYDSLRRNACTENALNTIRTSIYGFDTNPTVWALSCLNMFFRGDGKSHIENYSSLSDKARQNIKESFNRAFLNPPFSQEDEPEREFIDASMDALYEGGLFAGVIYAGVFADEENSCWRENFLKKHTLLAMISLPDELFYPNASAITTIMIAKAHVPQKKNSKILLGRITNDGYTKLKGKRVACEGSQLPEVEECFNLFMKGIPFKSEICCLTSASKFFHGAEFSPQQYMPQGEISEQEIKRQNKETMMSLFKSVTTFPEITDSLKDSFNQSKTSIDFPLDKELPLSSLFDVKTGKSQGVKNYSIGIIPYVSSGDDTNGIVSLVLQNNAELCEGCITVSAFGTAYLQPWDFMARGNGGSSVRVLVPKYKMTIRELFWFVAQINAQKWRFTYARQAIKTRLLRLKLKTPPSHLEEELDIVERINQFKEKLSIISAL